jgi:hypothetical protein
MLAGGVHHSGGMRAALVTSRCPADIYEAARIEGLPVWGQPEVSLICGPGRLHRARPADPLQPGRDLRVIQAGIIAAVEADELEHIGATTVRPVLRARGRLAPQNGPETVTELADTRDCRDARITRSACRIVSRPGAGHGRLVWPSHSTPRLVSTAGVWSSSNSQRNLAERSSESPLLVKFYYKSSKILAKRMVPLASLSPLPG